MNTILEELIELTLRYSKNGEIVDTSLSGFHIARSDAPTGPVYTVYEPSLCYILQGEKVATIGDTIYKYGSKKYLVTSVNLPVVGKVIEATSEKPYLCLILTINPTIVYEIVSSVHFNNFQKNQSDNSVFTDKVSTDLTNAFLRLMRILDKDYEREILSPLLIKEITFYLLKSKYAGLIKQIGIAGSQIQRISKVIEIMRKNFVQPLRTNDLAKSVNMSVPAFYQYFKKVTLLTPLQFQKQLRLQEARRLLSTEIEDAASVSYMVGYESPSQFSREYARLFGLPPIKDIKRLKEINAI